jgi:hypothetical protein
MSYYILPKINNDSAITNIIKTFKQKCETVKIRETGETEEIEKIGKYY